jgi:hypothetical protein
MTASAIPSIILRVAVPAITAYHLYTYLYHAYSINANVKSLYLASQAKKIHLYFVLVKILL